jgi:hypothetical protein
MVVTYKRQIGITVSQLVSECVAVTDSNLVEEK